MKRFIGKVRPKKVIIHYLVSKNTVDEDIIKALSNKEVNQSTLLEAIKARLKR